MCILRFASIANVRSHILHWKLALFLTSWSCSSRWVWRLAWDGKTLSHFVLHWRDSLCSSSSSGFLSSWNFLIWLCRSFLNKNSCLHSVHWKYCRFRWTITTCWSWWNAELNLDSERSTLSSCVFGKSSDFFVKVSNSFLHISILWRCDLWRCELWRCNLWRFGDKSNFPLYRYLDFPWTISNACFFWSAVLCL